MRARLGWKRLLPVLLAGLVGIAGAPAAAKPDRVGILYAQQYGSHGSPVILLPGLGCGPWVWQRTIADLERDHVVYAVTPAGFDGTPPPARMTGLLDRVQASLLRLIEQRHLHKPVLVGHSLGGAMALRFAAGHSALIAGAVSIDAPPIIPGMDQPDPEKRGQLRAMLEQIGPATALADMQQTVIDPAMAARYAPLVARSDAAAMHAYLAEGLDADYRPLMKHAQVPILEIAAYYRPDFERDAATAGRPVQSEEDNRAYFQDLMAGAPQARAVSISPARHFVMLDQPERFRQVLDEFLASLPPEAGAAP